MWFKNLNVYRLPRPWPYSADAMAEHLAALPLRDPETFDARSIGWVAPRDGGAMVHAVNGQFLFALGIIEKLLPAAVVAQYAADKAQTILEEEGRKVGRKEMRDIREATAIELMPRAFKRRRVMYGWIDPANGWLVIDSGSSAKTEEFIEHLRHTINIPLQLVKTKQSPISAMTGWVAEGDAPHAFTIDQDLRLESAEHATVNYARHTLEGEEIRQHIAAGKIATQLAMTWDDKISFVLTSDLKIKRLAFLDILKEQADNQAENEDERFDIDFTLMTGEVARLLDSLIAALGGEPEREADLLTGAAQAATELDNLAREDGATGTLTHNGTTLATFGDGPDPLYDQAMQIVRENQRASISLIQRHLRIGYNRAARLIEEMEQRGAVSTMDRQGSRTVLISENTKEITE